MNIVSWNVRGTKDPKKFRGLFSIVQQKNPSILFLIESKCRDRDFFESLRQALGFRHGFMQECSEIGGGGVTPQNWCRWFSERAK
ncbi:hypothetical protein ACLB2K_003140 [Fragaria x ananassa]